MRDDERKMGRAPDVGHVEEKGQVMWPTSCEKEQKSYFRLRRVGIDFKITNQVQRQMKPHFL